MEQMEKETDIDQVIIGSSDCMGALLRRIRRQKLKLSQNDFGDRCGISQRMISYMERAGAFHHFGLAQLFRVAYGIGVLPSDLLNYVESSMVEENPELMRPFFAKRRYYERLRRRWMTGENANSARLFEALRETLVLLQNARPSDISDEDIVTIRRILDR